MARADATCPKVAAQASLKYWAPAICPPHHPESSSPRSFLHSRARGTLCSRVPGSGICPACSPLVLHMAHDPSRPLWSRLRTPLCPRGRATGAAHPPPRVLPAACAWTSPGPRVHPTLPGPVHRWPHLPAASAPGTPVPHPSPGGRAGGRHLGAQALVSSRGPRPEQLALTLAPRVSKTPSTRLSASRLQLLRPEPTWCLPSPRPRARGPDLELPSPHRCARTPSPGPPALQPTGPASQPATNRPDKRVTSSPGTRGTSPLVPTKQAPTAPADPLCPSAGPFPIAGRAHGCHAHRSPHRGWGVPPAPGWGTPGMPGSLSAGTRAGPPGDCSVAGGRPPSGYEHRSPPPRGAWHTWVSAKRPSGAP